MSQNPLGAYVAKNISNFLAPLTLDASGSLVSGPGKSSSLNVTAAAVVKASAGRVARIVVVNAGTTSGAFTLNDCTTTAAATAANTVWTMAYNASANVAGNVIALDFPFQNGIVVSAVPGGGTPQLSISYI